MIFGVGALVGSMPDSNLFVVLDPKLPSEMDAEALIHETANMTGIPTEGNPKFHPDWGSAFRDATARVGRSMKKWAEANR